MYGQPFQRSYGNPFGNEAGTVVITEQGNLFIGGWYDVSEMFTAEFYGLHIAPNGDTLWARTFGEKVDTNANGRNGSGNEGYCAIQSLDGGFMIVGEVHGFGAGTSDVYAVKVNALGAYEWSRTYGGEEPDYGEFVVQLPDSGYAIAGFTESLQAGIRDMYLLRIDRLGNLLWSKTYGGNSIDAASELRLTEDGGFILVGYTFSFGEGGSDVYVIKTDSLGNVSWQKAYGGLDNDFGYAVNATFDGGYIIAGASESFNGSEEALLIKLDAQGQVVWSKTYGGAKRETVNSITQTSDSGLVACGYTTSFGAGFEDVFAFKTDAAGDTLWTRCYGGNETDLGWSVEAFTSGRIAMAGNTYSFGAGNSDVYLISTDDQGRSNCHEMGTETQVTVVDLETTDVVSAIGSGGKVSQPQTISGPTATEVLVPCDIDLSIDAQPVESDLKLYPNPTRGFITLEWQRPLEKAIIKLQTIDGQTLTSSSISTAHTHFDLSEYPDGVYILQIEAHNTIHQKKLIKTSL